MDVRNGRAEKVRISGGAVIAFSAELDPGLFGKMPRPAALEGLR